jgi:hypothetical protein
LLHITFSILRVNVPLFYQLNVDRYDERELLLKRNIYELDADVIGLQEVVFGSKQLNELVTPFQKPENLSRHTNRHKVDLEKIGA